MKGVRKCLLFLALTMSMVCAAATEGSKVAGQYKNPNMSFPEDVYIIPMQDASGQWSFVNQEGTTLPGKYEDIGTPSVGVSNSMVHGRTYYLKTTYLPVKVNGKWGVINHCGVVVVKPEYDRIEPFRPMLVKGSTNYSMVAKATKKGKTITINGHGNKVKDEFYDPTHEVIVAYGAVIDKNEDGECKVLNRGENDIIGVESAEGGFILRDNHGGKKWRYFKDTDKVLGMTRIRSWYFEPGKNNIIHRYLDNGMVDSTAPVLTLEKEIDEDDNYIVSQDGMKKVLMGNGKLLAPAYVTIVPRKDMRGRFTAFIGFDKTGKASLVNTATEKEVIKGMDDIGSLFRHDRGEFLRVQKDGKWGVMTLEGNLVLPIEYSNIVPLGMGDLSRYLVVKKQGDDTKSLMEMKFDNTLETAVPFGIFTGYSNKYESDFIPASKNGSYGAYCKRNGVIIKPGQGKHYIQNGNVMYFLPGDKGWGGVVNAFDVKGKLLGSSTISNEAQLKQFFKAMGAKSVR